MHVLKILVPGLAEACFRKEERGSFFMQAEQYLESILGVEAEEWLSDRYIYSQGGKIGSEC